MIRHAALFRLEHAAGSTAEKEFLDAAANLAAIPGTNAFQLARETSPKNPFTFVLSMEFEDQQAYDTYNAHPMHIAFVENRWLPEVAEFMEHDTIALR